MLLKDVKKVGEKSISLLNNLGIYTVDDLVRYYPYRFEILAVRNINDEKFFDNMVVSGIVESNPIVSFFKRNLNKLSFRCNVQNKIIKVNIFNRAYMKNSISIGDSVTIIGKYNNITENFTASNILLRSLNSVEIIPIYHLCKGLTNKKINEYITNAISEYEFSNNIPEKLTQKYGFISEEEALKIVHNPKSEMELKNALKTLKYEELYTYMKKLKELKENNEIHDKKYIKDVNIKLVNNFINKIPFELTYDQKRVIKEIIDNIKSDTKMNRLLQGDVGSGKTIVTFVAAYACYTAGYQSIFMAPTEILANQHYENALTLFKDTDVKVKLLTGKLSAKQKKSVYNDLEDEKIDILIGTHALINEKVLCKNLGFVITDEQHRFGVNQRIVLKNKSDITDVLMMSATPIPRTYALTVYGDTNISSIKTLPKGRLPVITINKRFDKLKDVLNAIYSAIKNGNQAYVIAPMIEENEDTDYTNVYDLKHKFELAFKNYNIEILHGKMNNDEKEKIVTDYLNNKINILISTTVVEVGVDVKNATVMVIFNAEKFGLSTLHQLRGRVGRNSLQSYCYLISDKENDRLKIMEQENDGYKISEADFKLRGQGDLFGNRQSGSLLFKLSDVKKDYDLLVKVKNDVDNLC